MKNLKSEQEISKEIQNYLQENKIFQIRMNGLGSSSGMPDRIFLYKGILVGIEIKNSIGKPSKLQLKKLEQINKSGGLGLIVRDLEEVKTIIDNIDYSKEHVNMLIANKSKNLFISKYKNV